MMETIILACLKAQLIAGRVRMKLSLPEQIRYELIAEIRKTVSKDCRID